MPTSWPQPAVLTNLLSHPTAADVQTANDSKSTSAPSAYDHRVLALYKFVSPKFSKECLPSLKIQLETICRQHSARGTLLIAEEGINGTICYPFKESTVNKTDQLSDGNYSDDSLRKRDGESRDALLSFLQAKFDGSLRIRVSVADRPVFARLKIKIKSEIVTMHWQGDKTSGKIDFGDRDDRDKNKDMDENKDENASSDPSSPPSCGPCCPAERVGEYVKPRDWNKLLVDPDTVVIDTRNEYEIDVGTFRNAINPHTQSFVEFPDWIKRNLVDGTSDDNGNSSDALEKKELKDGKKIAMFCESMNCRSVCYILSISFETSGDVVDVLSSTDNETSSILKMFT
jgi:predicted sulfurtransferase